jgi:N utilization substance protein B
LAERWGPAGRIVQKQTGDWARIAGFALRLVSGVTQNREDLDRTLHGLEIGWSLDRQVSVDRNILRMAAFELLHMDSIPASATINEAIELAKKYSTGESGRFVNGLLGALAARRPAEAGTTPADAEDHADTLDDPELSIEEIPIEEELAPA